MEFSIQMNYGKKNEELKALKAKEIANGRLAMVAALGCFIQYDHTESSLRSKKRL